MHHLAWPEAEGHGRFGLTFFDGLKQRIAWVATYILSSTANCRGCVAAWVLATVICFLEKAPETINNEAVKDIMLLSDP